MRYLLSIFLFISVSAVGQEAYYRFENNWTDQMGNHNGIAKAGASFYTTNLLEGSYKAGFGFAAYNRMITSNKVDLSSGPVTINFGVRGTNNTTNRYLIGNQATQGGKGFRVFYDEVNQRIYIGMDDGTNEGFAYSADASLTQSSWNWVTIRWMDINAQYVKIFINGVQSGTDSIGLAGSALNDTIAIGSGRKGEYTFWGGSMDQLSIYKCALTQAQITSIYNQRANNYTVTCGSGTPDYDPHQFWPSTAQLGRSIPSHNGLRKYMTYGFPVPPSIVYSYFGYDSTYVLSVKQKYAIPEDVNNGDYVGVWRKTFTWRSSGAISYALLTHTDRFSINSTTGLITILDATKIDGKIVAQDTAYNVLVRTFDDIMGHEDDTAVIWVKERAYCRFFDFGGAGDSTRTNPANYIPLSTTKVKGYGYFLKRGVTYLNPGTVTTRGHIATEVHPTVIGAWGTGAKPRIRSTAVDFFQAFTLGYYPNVSPWYSDSVDRAENIDIYDIHFQNWYGSVIAMFMPASHFGMYNLDIMNCNRQGGQDAIKAYDANYIDSSWYQPNEIINLVADTTGSTGTPGTAGNKAYIKMGGGPLFLTNFWFGSGIDQTIAFYALRLTNGAGSIIKHGYIKPESMSDPTDLYASGGIQNRQQDVTIEDVVVEGSNVGIYSIASLGAYPAIPLYLQNSPDNLIIKNVYFKDNVLYGFLMRQAHAGFYASENNIIENCLFENAPTGLLFREWRDGIIRRNKFVGGNYGIVSSTAELSNGVDIYYNLIYDQAVNCMQATGGTDINLYNNTIDGPIVMNSMTTSYVRNCFYTTSTINTSNNLTINSTYFINYAGNNYWLKEDSEAIDQGTDVNLDNDYYGTSVPQGISPDVGYFEFIQ